MWSNIILYFVMLIVRLLTPFGIDMLCSLSDAEVLKHDMLIGVSTELLVVVSDEHKFQSLLIIGS
jgi:hypothetical protein